MSAPLSSELRVARVADTLRQHRDVSIEGPIDKLCSCGKPVADIEQHQAEEVAAALAATGVDL